MKSRQQVRPAGADDAFPRVGWDSIVHDVAVGIPAGWEALYQCLLPLRFEIAAKVGRDQSDDLYHDTIVTLVDAIRKGQLHTPDALPAFARTILRRKVFQIWGEARATVHPDSFAFCDRSPNPEQQCMRLQRSEIAVRILLSLPASQREVLVRFYLQRQAPAEIQRAMRLTATQFRLMKSRAIAYFGQRGRAYTCRRRARSRIGRSSSLTSAASQF